MVGMIVDDPDANGAPDAGETYDLIVSFKNYGFAQVDGASAALSSSDPDVSIGIGSDTVGDLGRLITGSATFQVTESDVVFKNGRGYGHGLGLCQWGAQGQALDGKSAAEILRYYYPGAKLTRVY